jgi:DNA-3-methyladenine glycosylase
MKVGKDFFARDTLVVAKDLLGMEIVRVRDGKIVKGIITETEAYKGFADKASHASRGRTARTEPMFGEPGTIYIYLIYGMYYCFNIVTEREEYPAAVLIRGVRVGDRHFDGPGKFTRAFHITKELNTKNITLQKELYLSGTKEIPKKIIRTPRVGVDYAQLWAQRKWRFLLQ